MNTETLSKNKVIKSLTIFSLTFFLVLAVFITHQLNIFSSDRKVNECIIKNFTLSQMVSSVGEPIRWIKVINTSSINDIKHCLELPNTASNVKVSTIIGNKLEINKTPKSVVTDRQKLSALAKENSESEASLALANSIKNKPGFFATIFNTFSKILSSMLAAVEMGTSTDVTIIDVAPVVSEATSTDAITSLSEEVIVPETTSTEVTESTSTETPTESISSEIVSTTTESTTSTPEVAETSTTTETASTTIETISDEALATLQNELPNYFVATSTEATTTETALAATSTEASSTVVIVQYETPAPTIAEAETDTGKLVTVSAPEGEVPATNILAFTKIPEIYKVGQEDKIKIKWTNNNNQEVTFHAYDLNGNGKLDYVEWTVPHLSTQTFEIIFISKAFQLDANKEIVADIYDQVQAQDNVWASIPDTNYIRATFDSFLTDKNDNTIYARPTSSTSPATIEVYPIYTDQDGNDTQGPLVATFENIDHEGKYKVLLTNLQTSTDIFLFKVIGNVDIDYVVDPHPSIITDDFNDSSKINLASISNIAVMSGMVGLTTLPTIPDAPTSLTAVSGDMQVSLSWIAPVNNGGGIDHYEIYRSISSGGETFLTEVGNVLNYSDVNVFPGTTYYYKVSAKNSAGESVKSTEASVSLALISQFFASNADASVYRFKWNGSSWDKTSIGGTGYATNEVTIGDGNNDGSEEVYAVSNNGGVYQFKWNGSSWDGITVFNLGYSAFTSVAISDGNNDGVKEIYVGSSFGASSYLYQFKWNGSSWDQMQISAESVGVNTVTAGDGNNDGAREIYAGTLSSDGYVYQYKWNGSSWGKTPIGRSPNGSNINSVTIGDGNNDGVNEIYAADNYGNDNLGHVFQFKFDGVSTWTQTDMGSGTAGGMYKVVLGDGNNDGSKEVYGANADGHIYQFKWNGSSWDKTDLGIGGPGVMRSIGLADGNNDNLNEIYGGSGNYPTSEFYIYQFKWNGSTWDKVLVDTGSGYTTSIIQTPLAPLSCKANYTSVQYGYDSSCKWVKRSSGGTYYINNSSDNAPAGSSPVLGCQLGIDTCSAISGFTSCSKVCISSSMTNTTSKYCNGKYWYTGYVGSSFPSACYYNCNAQSSCNAL